MSRAWFPDCNEPLLFVASHTCRFGDLRRYYSCIFAPEPSSTLLFFSFVVHVYSRPNFFSSSLSRIRRFLIIILWFSKLQKPLHSAVLSCSWSPRFLALPNIYQSVFIRIANQHLSRNSFAPALSVLPAITLLSCSYLETRQRRLDTPSIDEKSV